MSKRQHVLLEIGLEEVPARFMRDAVAQLEELMRQWLTTARIGHGAVKTYATPRRLAVLVMDVEGKQADMSEEVRGPSRKAAVDEQGEWSKAALGFARSQGIAPEQLTFKEYNGADYVFAVKKIKGEMTEALLPEACVNIINSLHFPKTMRWGHESMRFVRPIRWVLALYGSAVIPFQIGNVTSGQTTQGHRFLGAQQIKVKKAEQYEQLLREQYVYVDIEERKQLIVKQIEQLAANHTVYIDERLLEEVLFLVEYPTAFIGQFHSDFLNIPQQVLITSMREHQRYFPLMDENGRMLPYFIAVRNGDAEGLEQVVRGNEKVLRARLADAKFFYEEDQKMPLSEALERLEKVVFHERLGTIADKVRRIQQIAAQLTTTFQLADEAQAHVARAAELCKFDLVTQMVHEFPELQGVMGEDYALKANEDKEVARAISEHYKPRFSGDESPATAVGAVVGLADKLDTLTGCFLIGIVPTGSQDPYGLRRQAAGIVQILKDYRLHCSPHALFDIALQAYADAGMSMDNEAQVRADLYDFLLLRVKNLLANDVRYDVADALIATGYDDIAALIGRGKALMAQIDQPQLKAQSEAFVRVMRLAGQAASGQVDPALFQEQRERQLYETWQEIAPVYAEQMKEREAEQALLTLGHMQQPINQFFDDVMVMVEDERLKHNRLALLAQIAQMIQTYADFEKLVW